MFNFASEKLTRQLEYLAGLPDGEFLFAVGDVLRSLEGNPLFASHIADLCHEADDLGEKLRGDEYDNGNPGRILEMLWDELEKRSAGAQKKQLFAVNPEFRKLLGDLDHPIIVPLDPNGGGEDGGRIGRMLKLMDELQPTQVVPQGMASLERLRGRQEEVHRRMLRLTRTHAGVALLRLRCITDLDEGGGFREQAESCPRNLGDRPSLVVSVIAGERRWDGLLDLLLSGQRGLSEMGDAPALVAALRGAVARVGVELEGRIGTVRSRLALVDRYKARCEWHDRERLFGLAEAATGARESVLRDDLALYLFDNGLNPISEASLGAHARGDVFHPDFVDSFLLEAKQYSDGSGLESALRAAFRQALDTAGNLRGSGFDADEAFIVLFRRGGPRAVLPTDPVVADGLRWYLRLINIAPADVDASRNKVTPKEYSVDELRRLLIDVQSEAAAAPDQ